ncbi:MAG: sensor histidine kinase N-terminal domain-containing protein [Alphaproteobacteria bacterium]|nr:sensor histidine kinase N-terminal domain-containing protein [Alphaproteobacteria bacterium]HRI77187.1 ATP-binding protein [Alphaproteobacteria bacterium]
MKKNSLRLRLIKTLLLQMLAAVVLSGGLALAFIYHEVDEVYDATLVQFSRSLASMPIGDANPESYAGLDRSKDAELAHRYERKISYRILKDGQVITASAEGPAMEGIYLPPGFSKLHHDKKGRHEWRVYTLLDEKSGLAIEVAEKYDIRRELTFQLLSSLVLPGILFIISSIVAIWWATGSSLKVLARVSGEVGARAAEDLSSIDDRDIPIEIKPLTHALNDLFARIETSFLREREFTDNAAHELRTPLAAIKAQVQALQRSENLSAAGQEGFANLLAAVDRAAAMTDALLSFARLQGERSDAAPVLMADIVRQEIQALAGFAAARQVRITPALEEVPPIQGVPHALGLMVRNVLHNAVKFSPQGGEVVVTLSLQAGAPVLSIADAGAGIADKHLPHVFERFYRADKSQIGSGLGLSIVKWVADTHRARVALAPAQQGGLDFKIFFSKA